MKSKNFQNNERVVDEDDSWLLMLHLATSDAENENNSQMQQSRTQGSLLWIYNKIIIHELSFENYT